TLADVDVAARELERRIEPHVGRVFDRLMDGEERRDLDEAADARDQDDADHKADRLAFQLVMESKNRHGHHSAGWTLRRPGSGTGRSPVFSTAPAVWMVIQTFQAPMQPPIRNSKPPKARAM